MFLAVKQYVKTSALALFHGEGVGELTKDGALFQEA